MGGRRKEGGREGVGGRRKEGGREWVGGGRREGVDEGDEEGKEGVGRVRRG